MIRTIAWLALWGVGLLWTLFWPRRRFWSPRSPLHMLVRLAALTVVGLLILVSIILPLLCALLEQFSPAMFLPWE